MACAALGVQNADLHIYQGDDYAAAVEVVQADGITPVDLTGWTALAQIRSNYADESDTVVAVLTTEIQGSMIYLSLLPAITATLSGRYVWDLQLTSPLNAVVTVLRGAVIAVAEVTR